VLLASLKKFLPTIIIKPNNAITYKLFSPGIETDQAKSSITSEIFRPLPDKAARGLCHINSAGPKLKIHLNK